jgi:hypothetical protein
MLTYADAYIGADLRVDMYKYIGAHSAKKIERPAPDKTSVERPAEHDTSNLYSGTLLALLVPKVLAVPVHTKIQRPASDTTSFLFLNDWLLAGVLT